MVDHDENLRIISLNTIVWYKSNKQVDGTGDPNMQFEWLESALGGARELGKKVFYFKLVYAIGRYQINQLRCGWFKDQVN